MRYKQMSSPQRATGIYCYRRSCQPFASVFAIARVTEPVEVSDTYSGEGCYSLQFNAQGKDGAFIQGALQFFNGARRFTLLQIFEFAKGKVVTMRFLSSNDAENPLPQITGLEAGLDYVFQFVNDGKSVSFFCAIKRDQTEIWNSGAVSFAIFSEPQIVTIAPVGFGTPPTAQIGSDSASFRSGHFFCSIIGDTSVTDLDYALQLPTHGIPEIPCGAIAAYTAESSNLFYDVDEESESQDNEVSFEVGL